MKHFLFILLLLAFCSCKTQHVVPIVFKDSVSITYKQGQEQPTPTGVRGAAIESRKNSSVPAAWCPRQTGKPYLGKGQTSTQGASVFEEVLSERTNKPAVPPTPIIRVDTVFVERWHTQTIREPTPPPSGGRPILGCREGASKFYKDCTLGFFILLLLILGGIALRITKAIYLHR